MVRRSINGKSVIGDQCLLSAKYYLVIYSAISLRIP